MGQLLIHGAPYCAHSPFKLVQAEPSHPKKLVSIYSIVHSNVETLRVTQPRTGGGGRVRGSVGVAGSRGGGVSVFPDSTAAWRPARAGPPRCTARHPPRARRGPRTLGRAPMCGPPRVFTANSHRAHVRLTSDRSRACIRRARTRLTTAFTRHTTRGRRVPPTPDHRPSRPRPDASITVGSEGVRLMARARPL